MIKFLIHKPVAVMMSFLAAVILGVITYFTLPVSLLPDISIPEITVQISSPSTSARQLENNVVRRIRSQLLQVAHLSSIESRTRDGQAVIRMRFGYGTDTDYTFIEVNEKIDAAMNSLPKDLERPRVIKASATDLPVFNLNLTLKEDLPFEDTDSEKFLELSDFATNVIKRRLEQLPEVAMVDGTGTESRQLSVIPDESRMTSVGLTIDELEQILVRNNAEPSPMTIQDGYYEYNVKFSSVLRTREDVENIYFEKNGRMYRLSDVAQVVISPEKVVGYSYFNGKRSIVFSVIKQSDASMEGLKKSVNQAISRLEKQYPTISFDVSQNQTELLDFTLSNLQSNLWQGLLLICVISILFFKDVRTPLIISLGLVVALVISMLFYYLCGLSLNIISLSGLILALGMMIDSSIIVTDNISQYREKDGLLDQACIRGTNEIITPLLSSILTTIAVFVPLVFVSGIAGALFYDQAVSVSLGLAASYIVGIFFLPVAYRIVYGSKKLQALRAPGVVKRFFDRVNLDFLFRWYDKGFVWIFSNRRWITPSLLLVFPLIFFLFQVVEKRKMPYLDHSENIVTVEWNENIHVDENRARTLDLLAAVQSDSVLQSSALVGEQQFLLQGDGQLMASETSIYLKSFDTETIEAVTGRVLDYIGRKYPKAKVSVSPPENVFEKVFDTSEAEFTAQILRRENEMEPHVDSLLAFIDTLAVRTGGKAQLPLSNQINVTVDSRALILYGVSFDQISGTLSTLFGENTVSTLRSNQQYLPIVISSRERDLDEVFSRTMVSIPGSAQDGGLPAQVPLSSFIRVTQGVDFKTIYAGKNGEYVPVNYTGVEHPDRLVAQIREETLQSGQYDADFTGSVFTNRELFLEMAIVLGISLLLLYFILAAQFESLAQPLIVLLEIPIDIAAALLMLWVCGNSINVMSVIGMVVACGIVINDSILKIDIINQLRKGGMPTLQAIHIAGHRRLRAIVMTSLTTILAMVPLLFSSDMGSELQAPLSLSIIGGMLVGTPISLYVIPVIYWFIYSKGDRKEKEAEAALISGKSIEKATDL